MFDCFLILFPREKLPWKKQRQVKMWFYGNTFSYKAGVLFLIDTVSNSLDTFETNRPFLFYTRT